MASVIPDTLDWKAYERQTAPAVKIRKAGMFEADLLARLAHRETSRPEAEMFSTKLRGAIDFRPGEVTAWAGYNGHRKSMFTGQVALDLCVQKKRTLIASMEMSPADTLERMLRQASGTRRPTADQAKVFSKWSDNRLWLFDHIGRIDPASMLAVLRYFADELKGQQAFIDSMMMVCASEESLDEQKQFTTDLVRTAQETGLHIHLVTHCRKPQTGEEKKPTKYDLRGSAAISDQAHNVVTIWANKAKKAALEKNPHDPNALDEPDAVVTVEKQRNGGFEGAVKLWFADGAFRFCDDRTSQLLPYDFLGGRA